jgi:anti-anti-sigma regulatory factor
VFELRPVIERQNASIVERALSKFVNSRVRDRVALVDCSGVEKIDAYGLKMLDRVRTYAEEDGRVLVLTDPTPGFREAAEAAGLETLLTTQA